MWQTHFLMSTSTGSWVLPPGRECARGSLVHPLSTSWLKGNAMDISLWPNLCLGSLTSTKAHSTNEIYADMGLWEA